MSGYGPRPIDSFDYHHSMLTDDVRTAAYRDAIAATVRPGDVVVDIGSGTGVLSMFAAMSGASRVYAIEREPIIDVAREIAERNGFDEVITFLEGSSLDIELPERADVLITETIGNAGLNEGIVAWVADARNRLLEPGAAVIPISIDVVACLVSVPADYESIERWRQPLHDLDFSPLGRIARNNLHSAEMNRSALVSEPVTLFTTDLVAADPVVSGQGATRATRDALSHGIGVWFSARLTPGNTLSNAPPNIVPSWEQGFLPFDQPREIQRGTVIDVEISCSSTGDIWTWRAASGEPSQTTYEGRSVRRPTLS